MSKKYIIRLSFFSFFFYVVLQTPLVKAKRLNKKSLEDFSFLKTKATEEDFDVNTENPYLHFANRKQARTLELKEKRRVKQKSNRRNNSRFRRGRKNSYNRERREGIIDKKYLRRRGNKKLIQRKVRREPFQGRTSRIEGRR